MKKLFVLLALFPLQSFASNDDFLIGFVRGAWHGERANIAIRLEAEGIPFKTVAAVLDAPACQTPPMESLVAALRDAQNSGEQQSSVILAGAIGELARQACLGREE